jgi:hypothetical protein
MSPMANKSSVRIVINARENIDTDSNMAQEGIWRM